MLKFLHRLDIKLSITKCYLSDASIPHTGVLVVDNLARPARAWELTFTTHALNAVRDYAVTIVVDN